MLNYFLRLLSTSLRSTQPLCSSTPVFAWNSSAFSSIASQTTVAIEFSQRRYFQMDKKPLVASVWLVTPKITTSFTCLNNFCLNLKRTFKRYSIKRHLHLFQSVRLLTALIRKPIVCVCFSWKYTRMMHVSIDVDVFFWSIISSCKKLSFLVI